MDVESLSPEEREVWCQIMRDFPPDYMTRMDPCAIAEVCGLVVKMRKDTMTDADEARALELFDSLGMCGPDSRIRLRMRCPFKAN
jgi:hypothetical protein